MRRAGRPFELGSSGRRAQFAPLLAALLAVFLQAFVVQTHIHAFGTSRDAGYEQSVGGGQAARPDAHVSTTHGSLCVFCEVFASSGRALVPTAAQAELLAQTDAEITTPALPQAPRAITHGWRSRAPPLAA